jgi:hypothetical protein
LKVTLAHKNGRECRAATFLFRRLLLTQMGSFALAAEGLIIKG